MYTLPQSPYINPQGITTSLSSPLLRSTHLRGSQACCTAPQILISHSLHPPFQPPPSVWPIGIYRRVWLRRGGRRFHLQGLGADIGIECIAHINISCIVRLMALLHVRGICLCSVFSVLQCVAVCSRAVAVCCSVLRDICT